MQSPPARPGPSPIHPSSGQPTTSTSSSSHNHFSSGYPSPSLSAFAAPSSSSSSARPIHGTQPTSIPIGFASNQHPRSPPPSHRGSFTGSFGGSMARSFRLGSFGAQGSFGGLGGFGQMGSYDDKMVRMGSWKGRFVGAENGLPWQAGGVE